MTRTSLAFLLTLGCAGSLASAGIRVEARSADAVRGALAGPPASVAFGARAEDPSHAVAQVRVGAFRIDGEIDLREGLVRVDGHGSEVTPDHRAAWIALSRELERFLVPLDRTLPLQERFLLQLSMLLSEAPVGLVIDSTEIRSPQAADSTASPFASSCQQNGQSGISYLSGGCALTLYGAICYDTASQCFGCFAVQDGCSRPLGCPGRCGAGCGTFGGAGVYTRDCAEHDLCCGQNGDCQNPFALHCGDEFWEAADDFLFGWILTNCPQGCP